MATRGRLVRRVLLGLVLLVVVALVGGYWYARPLLLTGTGYAAHNACAVEQVAGRDDPDADLPPNPLVPFLRSSTGSSEGAPSVTGSLLGVLAKQTAHHTDGYGCTLADEAPDLPEPTAISPGGFAALPSTREVPPAGVRDAVGRAFGDDLSEADRDELGTRAVVVVHRGRVVTERYADGFTADTPQLGWSMTKSVTNLLVGRLVADGEVAIDDAGLRPEWTDERADITIDQLMRMTGGLAWDETYDLGTPITRMLYLEPDMGAYVASQDAAHEPGTYQQYSSGSTTLLCAILGERTGDGADLPRSRLFAPLGLSSAVIEPDAVGTPVCSSYMWATPRDWAAVGQFALVDGVVDGERLLPEGWMAASTTAADVETTEEDEPYAAGWWVNQAADGSLFDETLPEDTYFAQGHDGQWIAVVPSADLVVVRLGFTPDTELDDRVRPLVADLVDELG